MDLTTTIAGMTLRTPLIAASGTFGYGTEYSELVDPTDLGAIVTKGITLKPREGNPPPRLSETPSGMLNSIGLENVGVEAFLRDKLHQLEDIPWQVIANVSGSTVEEYRQVVGRLAGADRVNAIELNVSCPNVQEGGILFGKDPALVYEVVKAARLETEKVLICKLTPNVSSIVDIAEHAVEAGADCLSLINTLHGMSVDVEARRPMLGSVVGGLSGPAIRPVALYYVWQVVCSVGVPIIGIGGILTPRDALEFFLAGASAVQIGTGLFVDPAVPHRIIEGLHDYGQRHGFSALQDLMGTLRVE
jgi:dihydroorotate dehydrogenase (NAD+) catalytic subunit